MRDGIEMTCGLDKWVEVTLRKTLLIKSKNITIDINGKIPQVEHNKTRKYQRIKEANGINITIKEDKNMKVFSKRVKLILRI